MWAVEHNVIVQHPLAPVDTHTVYSCICTARQWRTKYNEAADYEQFTFQNQGEERSPSHPMPCFHYTNFDASHGQLEGPS